CDITNGCSRGYEGDTTLASRASTARALGPGNSVRIAGRLSELLFMLLTSLARAMDAEFPESTRIASMRDIRSLVQVAKNAQLVCGGRCDNVDDIGNCQWPACCRTDLVHTDVLIAGH